MGIEVASLISKSHRTKALPTALGFNCCQVLPTLEKFAFQFFGNQFFVPPVYREKELLSMFLEYGTQGQLKFTVFFRRFRLLRFFKKHPKALLKFGDHFEKFFR
jgi:hypothetical protein